MRAQSQSYEICMGKLLILIRSASSKLAAPLHEAHGLGLINYSKTLVAVAPMQMPWIGAYMPSSIR